MQKMMFTRVKGQPCDMCHDFENGMFAVFFHDDLEFVTWQGTPTPDMEAAIDAAIAEAADRINAKRGVGP